MTKRLSFNELKKKYADLSLPVKASLWFTVCNILQRGISLISTPIFTRLMTTDQYGVYSVYQSWYNVIAVFATLNLYCGVFNNGLTKYPENRKAFTSSMQGLSTLTTILVLGVYCINIPFWNSILKLDTVFVLLIFAELLFLPAYQFWTVQQRYEYKYRSLIVVTLIMAFAGPAIGIVAVINTSYKSEARVFSYVLVQVIVGLIFYI